MPNVKLYGAGSATASAVAQITIPSKGRIVGVQWAVAYDFNTDNARVSLEISRASASQIATNGDQQCIAAIDNSQNLVTSGMSTGGLVFFTPVSIDVVQGQIIYLHALVSGTASYFATAILTYR